MMQDLPRNSVLNIEQNGLRQWESDPVALGCELGKSIVPI
jgi:hypothetical protein